ncbi:MAG: methionyl-tRNA formyltransferase [Candidatus Obscuribacterales bacterium]|nr:methionyl-tRNA formyltransferase [Candidatus Obscuribacterales bacterium]
MRIVFMGNGPFAVATLERLINKPYAVEHVVTRPDRPQGKRNQIERGPVAQAADRWHLGVEQPESANSDEFIATLSQWSPDLLVVADFGQILSTRVLETARYGGINVHGSLLPKYRGAAPVAWAIYHGEPESGVSIIQMTRQLDGGGVILQQATPIGPDETAGQLEERLAVIGGDLACRAVAAIAEGGISPIPQDRSLVTQAPRLSKEDGRINWARSAQQVHDQVRAMSPWPIAFTYWPDPTSSENRLQVLRTKVVDGVTGLPGDVISLDREGLVVGTGHGSLILSEVRPAGRRLMTGEEFARGARITTGSRFS